MSTLAQVKDTDGQYHAVHPDEVVKAAQEVLSQSFAQGKPLTSTTMASDYVQVLLSPLEHEVFYVIWMDTQHKIIKAHEIFRGSIAGAVSPPREVVKEGLRYNAAAVIFAHNHPSGCSDPSKADVEHTQTLKQILDVVDIQVLDHLIVGTTVTSLAQRGLL